MIKPPIFAVVLLIGASVLLASAAERAAGALVGESGATLAELMPAAAPILGGPASLLVRFVQEDGPEAGAVRVELTPETRSLTILEARSAAQQAFLDALTEPGLGDPIRRVRVVVRLTPAGIDTRNSRQQVFLYVHKGGREWSVLGGD